MRPGALRNIGRFTPSVERLAKEVAQHEKNADAFARVVNEAMLTLEPTRLKTSVYAAKMNDLVLLDSTSGNAVVLLPRPRRGVGWIALKNTGGTPTSVTVVPGVPGATIDGDASYTLRDADGFAILVPISPTQWVVISQEKDPTPRYMDNRYDPVGVWWMGNVGGADDAVPGAKDYSGNGLDLTVENGSRRYMYIHPKLLGAYFDGSWNLHESTADSSLAITGDMTCMFVTILETGADTTTPIVSHFNPGELEADNILYYLETYNTNDGLRYIHEYSTGTNDELSTPNRPARGQIAMLGFVRENDDVTLYINGAEGAPASSGFSTPTGGGSGKLRVGGDGSAQFTGLVSNLAIYNTALTAAQMAERFNWVLGPQYGFV